MSPLPHELKAGDVVLLNNAPHTILFATNSSVDSYAYWRLTFSDSSEAVVSATQQIARIHPPDDEPAIPTAP